MITPLASEPASTARPEGPGDPPPSGTSAASAPRRRSHLGRALEPLAFLSPTLILLAVLMVLPIVLVIGYAFMDNVVTNPDPEFVGPANLIEIATDPTFHIALRNTVVFTVVSVVAHMILGLTFAMLLNSKRVSVTSRAVLRAIYVMPWLFTVAVIAVLWRMLLAPSGVINYLLSTDVEWLADPRLALGTVTVINIWAGYPFFMVSLLAGLQGIPGDLYEAARVDGASPVQQFFHVTLPQLRQIIVSLLLLDMIWTSAQQFALIWMTTGGGPLSSTEMLSTYTYKLAFDDYEFGLASASAVLVLLVSMVLAFFYVRHEKARES
ncbi:carbohydrate ABC transporter permease [Ruania rhizosphaerae]|uniref:carbohydrate ABC transporter permease n=1 Tax=Ruania rhizosphaerae TaxID=1840413 RepID=UPI00135C47C2|nr:sugar ABC transporter permease [Ruania rhizosphaerae]